MKFHKRKDNGKKSERHYDHCNPNGHLRDTSLKLHGYLEWYKYLKNKKDK